MTNEEIAQQVARNTLPSRHDVGCSVVYCHCSVLDRSREIMARRYPEYGDKSDICDHGNDRVMDCGHRSDDDTCEH